MGGSGGAAVHTRRSRHSFHFACIVCCKDWFEGSHSQLGHSICDSLIGLHAFTGCDTVSAFASRRKLSALKPLEIDITYLETFSQVGQ